jgi:hypothetical protein
VSCFTTESERIAVVAAAWRFTMAKTALIVGLLILLMSIASAVEVSNMRMQRIDVGNISLSWAGVAPTQNDKAVYYDSEYRLNWTIERVFVDETLYNCIGSATSDNSSFNVTEIPWRHDLETGGAGSGAGALMYVENYTISTYKGIRIMRVGYFDTGSPGDDLAYGEALIDSHRLVFIRARGSVAPSLATLMAVGRNQKASDSSHLNFNDYSIIRGWAVFLF